MRVRSWMSGIAVMALCTAGSAFAAIDATQVGKDIKYNEQHVEVGAELRGGAGGLTGALGKITAPGLMFGVTADARPWRLVGVEGSYEGQRLPIDDARVGDEQAMYRHNVNLMAKAGPQLLDDKLRPYVGAGWGLSYLNASDGADTLYRNDWIWELPLAAGADYHFTKNFFAGARASYHVLFGEEFAKGAAAPNQDTGDLLNFNASIGGTF